MPLSIETAPQVRLYADMANLLLAQRYMQKLESIGAPHPERKTIDEAINLMAPGYRARIEHDVLTSIVFERCNIGPHGVEQAIRLARALREVYGIADKPRRSTTI